MPKAATVVTVRTRFHAAQRDSSNALRTAARSAIRSGSPATLIASLSGTFTAIVRTTPATSRTAATNSHTRNAPPSPQTSTVAAAVSTGAPKKGTMNHGLRIARSMAWNAATNVRSSTRRSAGIRVCA